MGASAGRKLQEGQYGKGRAACHVANVGRTKEGTRPVTVAGSEGSQGQRAEAAAAVSCGREACCARGDR